MKALILRRVSVLVVIANVVAAAACSGTSSRIDSGDGGGGSGSSSGASSGGGSSSGSSSGSGGSSGSNGSSGGSSSSSSGSSSGAGSSSGSSGAVDAGRSDARSDSGGPRDAGGDAAALSFATNVYPIITMRCIACHIPGGTGVINGHLDLTTGQAAGAYAQLMLPAMGTVTGSAALTCANSMLTRVVPGSAATSLLFDKVDSKLMGVPALCGNPMPNPMGAASLSAMQVATIQNWINQGANP